MRRTSHSSPGYVFLITVLLIGAIAVAVVTSLLFIATNAGRTSLILEQSARAESYAQACAEIALRSLRSNGTYAGGETVTMPGGTCRVLATGGSGNENRTLCVEGVSGATTRRFEIEIQLLLPAVRIGSWQEVPLFTLCAS